MAEAAALTRTQEERTEAAKERIRAAALVLFGEEGYEATTLAAISLKAGFSRTLAQYHYASKVDLALELLNERITRDNHLELLTGPAQFDPEEAWARIIRHLDAVSAYYGALHASGENAIAVRGEMALHAAALMGANPELTSRVHDLTVDLIGRIECLFEMCRAGDLIDAGTDVHALATLHVHSIWGLAQALFANPKGGRTIAAAYRQINVMLEAMRR